jgi:CelD/BcsL family acetyltransferase involved in cellulose biosynthesis
MQAELITEPARISEIEHPWRELAEARGNAFVTPEWFRSWWRHRDSSASALVVAVRSNGRLVGVMPLALDSSRRPRAIRFAGAAIGDRFHPAATVEAEDAVAQAAVRILEQQGFDRRMLLLEHIDSSRDWWRQMRAASSRRLATVEQQHAKLPYISLKGLDWERYLASRTRNFRSQVRRRERALRREHRVEVRPATQETLAADLSTLFDLHALRWRGRGRSSLEAAGAKAFLNDFAQAAQRRGWLRLRILEVDDAATAAFLGWRIGNTYAYYQSGFDPQWSGMSVGIVQMALTVRSAIEEGAAEFDMLLGSEDYKRRFTNADRSVQTVIFTEARRPTSLLVAGEAMARRYGRPLIERRGLGSVVRSMRRLLPTSRSI